MVNHLNLNNDKDFAFLLIKSIKNGSITVEKYSRRNLCNKATSTYTSLCNKAIINIKNEFLLNM